MKEPILGIKNKISKLISIKKINPHVHWRNLLYVFFAIITMLIIFSIYLLIDIRKQETFQISPYILEKPSLINEKSFNQTTELFDLKSTKEQEIKRGFSSYKDPSI